MSQDLRSLGAFMILVMVIVCLPKILAGVGAAILFLLQCIAAIIIGYIAIAIVVGLFMMIFNIQSKDGEEGGIEKAWKF